MMERIALILAVALASYATRIAGFTLDRRTIPPFIDRTLSYVPVAAFTALIIPGLGNDGGLEIGRIAGAVIAAVAVLITRQLWASLLAGMVIFWAWPWVF